MGPRESSKSALSRAAFDHPSAGPTPKTRCLPPESRHRLSHSAKASEEKLRPRLSSTTTVGFVRALALSAQSSISFSDRNDCSRHAAKGASRFKYRPINSLYGSLAERAEPMETSVSSMETSLAHERIFDRTPARNSHKSFQIWHLWNLDFSCQIAGPRMPFSEY
jgi:hypothetical protein